MAQGRLRTWLVIQEMYEHQTGAQIHTTNVSAQTAGLEVTPTRRHQLKKAIEHVGGEL